MIESVMLGNLIQNKEYARKVLPFIKPEYFQEQENKKIFDLIKNYCIEYSSLPTTSNLLVEANNLQVNEHVYQKIEDNIKNLDQVEKCSTEWLIDNTESYCKERALNNAILSSVDIIEQRGNTDQILEIVESALRVEFRSNVGYEFLDEKDINERWEAYIRKVRKLSTGIPEVDDCFGGGFELKTLNLTLGQTNSGKTAGFCSMAANMCAQGEDVLYITLEMAEEKIFQRIEANQLDVEINDIPLLGEKKYKSSVWNLKEKVKGRLIVKEFPSATINSIHLKNLISDLAMKKNFKPTVVIIDYINLMNSSRIKDGNSYTTIKSIAEEIRGIAVEYDLCMITGTQITRGGFNSSDINIEDTSESIGLPSVTDAMIGIIFPKDLREKNIQVWKILKNRYSGIVNKKIALSVDFSKSKICGIDEQNQEEVSEITGIINNDNSGEFLKEKMRQQGRHQIEVKLDDDDEELLNLLGE